jgi:outer membrane receptor protein involved in Fe transport
MRDFFLFLVLALPLAVWAGSGKIAGKVVDTNGDAVIGASVQLIETQQGSAVGVDGNYVILGVQPGTYTVRFTSVGYGTQTVTGVTVNSDVTTTINSTLKEEAIGLPEQVVTYQAPVVKLDVSSKETRFTREELETRAISSIGALLEKQPGFKVDAEGNIHVRGGRESETLVQVDGVSYRDPLVDSTRQLGSFSALNIQEVEVLTGGDARYGGFQAALINVSTPEGSMTDYAGTIEYRTDRVIPGEDKVDKHGISYRTNSFNQDQYDFSFSGPVPLAGKLLGPKKLSFFTSGMAKLSNTYIPYKVNREANDYMGLGFDIPERQTNDYSTFWKLTYRMDEAKKLNLTYSRDFSQWDVYPDGGSGISANYGWQYKYDVANRPYSRMTRQTINLGFSHNVSKSTLYEVSLGNFRTATDILPRGKTPGEFTLDKNTEDSYRTPNSAVDENNDGFVDGYVDANNNGQHDGEGEGYDDNNFNGHWDRGEDWVDLNGNGVYDAAEPWLDRANSQGVNHLGVYDPWDPFVDLNHNGRWDPAEPQLAEQDWNHNGHWDGERFIDANGNGKWDGTSNAEGYDDKNSDGKLNKKELYLQTEDRAEPFVDGDRWFDTGEPFIDLPDTNGFYNGRWDPGEVFYDLPSSFTGYFRTQVPTTNGVYDGPNGVFDEYELFTHPNWDISQGDTSFNYYGMNPHFPVIYTWEDISSPHGIQHGGQDWLNLGYDPTSHMPLYLYYDPAHSTWTNTTSYDNSRPVFDMPNQRWDAGKEAFTDYNGNGVQDPIADKFLNPGLWDATAFWMKRESSEWTGKFDLTSQVNKFHELKSGLELKRRDLQMNSIEQPDQPYDNSDVPLPAGSPYPDRGGKRDFYNYEPWEGGLYVQDKMEFEGMIVRAGLRSDFIIHDKKIREESQKAVDLSQPGALLAKRGKMVVAPRLGISHPISTRAKLYFNYGHYYQTPSFEYFYRSATANIAPNTQIGNPNLEYEKTVSYEVGVNTEFAEDWVVDVAGYYRDVYNQIGTVEQRIGPITLNRFFNLGYARARGFEFSLKKSLSSMWALTFNYDYSYAYGKESAASEGLLQRLGNIPENRDEHPLAWDETHKISAFVTIVSGQKDKPRLFNVRMPNDWVSTVEFAYGSGLPYTPSNYTVGKATSLILPNSARYPFTMTVDLKADKYWTPVKGLRFATGFEIYNLLNRRNVRELYAATGNPWDSSHQLDTSVRSDGNLGTDYDHNPRNYYPPRQILLHLRLQF